MGDRALRRRCEAVAGTIRLRRPFDLDDVVGQVARRRGRPLRLLPLPVPPHSESGIFGAWLALPTEDLVFVDSRAGGLHREHIVLHELAHMLCGHESGGHLGADEGHGGVPADLATLLPDLGPAALRHALTRSRYDDRQEREAETLASLLRAGAVTTPAPLSLSARLEVGAPSAPPEPLPARTASARSAARTGTEGPCSTGADS